MHFAMRSGDVDPTGMAEISTKVAGSPPAGGVHVARTVGLAASGEASTDGGGFGAPWSNVVTPLTTLAVSERVPAPFTLHAHTEYSVEGARPSSRSDAHWHD